MLGLLKNITSATISSRTSEFSYTYFDCAAKSSGTVMNLVQVTNNAKTECSTCTCGIHTVCVMKMPAVLCARVSDDDNKTPPNRLLVRVV